MAKFKTYEEALTALDAAKAERSEAKKAIGAYVSEHKLKITKDYSDDATHGKAWKKLQATINSKREAIKSIEEAVKELKPAKARVAAKYEYPADVVTEGDKKKFRSKMRAAAARAEKGETEVKVKKEKAPKAEKSEATAEVVKKKKKKVAVAESED